MNISINWLKKYVNLDDLSPKEIANKLTMSTVEVESVEPVAKMLENVFVGRIEQVMAHPNANKLRLADVNLGNETVRVVCGGTNLESGMLVALAKPGAKILWHGEGEPVRLEPTDIRGEKSFGMICAADEIGLAGIYSHPFGQILDLSEEKLTVGDPLAKALELDDYVVEIDNKSLTNRPDLWSHFGIARELAAIFGRQLKEISFQKIKDGKGVDLKIRVENPELCPAYHAVAIANIKVGPSPKWLKQALQSIGQKSINNIVDVTNYVMFEIGQPIHAFDAAKLKTPEVIIRLAQNGEKITTIDEQTRKLSEQMLVIADQESPIALAGIMGGRDSEISDATSTIIIESATFEPTTIRKTSLRQGLRTEASMRFEKSLDPHISRAGIERAVELIQQILPEACIASDAADFEKFKLDQGPIVLSKDFLAKRIGYPLEDKTVERILKNLGFEMKEKRKEWEVTVPTYRATGDISIKEDVVEEVARILGFDNIKPLEFAVKNRVLEPNTERLLERRVKEFLTQAFGSTEVRNYSFISPKLLDKLNMDYSNHWQLQNPWDEDQNLMRQNLWPHLVVNVRDNLRFNDNVNIFELGRVFLAKDSELSAGPNVEGHVPAQPYFLAGAYCDQAEPTPFYRAKMIVAGLLNRFQVEFALNLPTENRPYWHPSRCAVISVKNKEIGWVAELNPLAAQNLDIDEKVALWHINFSDLAEIIEPKYEYRQISKYPAAVYDLSLIIDEKTMYKDIAQIISSADPKLIKKIDLIDVFKNGKIKKGQESITLRITYQSDERTLEKEEIEKLQNKIIDQLTKALGAELRK
ncbi:MAG: phenylalanine--tRNA ligase subunit beta [Patescibacteria group bacterium]